MSTSVDDFEEEEEYSFYTYPFPLVVPLHVIFKELEYLVQQNRFGEALRLVETTRQMCDQYYGEMSEFLVASGGDDDEGIVDEIYELMMEGEHCDHELSNISDEILMMSGLSSFQIFDPSC